MKIRGSWLVGVAGVLVFGGGASAQIAQPVHPIAPLPTTPQLHVVPLKIACPPLGHKTGPDANGWTTNYLPVAQPVASVDATAGVLRCNYTTTVASDGSFPTYNAVAALPIAAGLTYCAAQPGGVQCQTSSKPMFFRCPAVSGTDTLDGSGWTTVHPAGTLNASIDLSTSPGSMVCKNTFSTPSGVGSATMPIGQLTGCAVGADQKSFNCLLPR